MVREEHGDGHQRGDVEPERDVEVPLAPAGERAEEVRGEDDPHHGDGDVDGPLELRVLLRLAVAERQRHRAATMMACQPQKWTRPRRR